MMYEDGIYGIVVPGTTEEDALRFESVEARVRDSDEQLRRFERFFADARPAHSAIVDEPGSELIPLPDLGCGLFRAASYEEYDEVKRRFREEFESDLFFDDFYVRTPTTEKFPLEPDAGFLAFGSHDWPEESGVPDSRSGMQGEGVLVGVIDSGVSTSHVEFENKTIDFENVISDSGMPDSIGFDVEDHGTRVCGMIAGNKIGVAPRVSLWVAPALAGKKKVKYSRIVEALNRFLSRANYERASILNLSLEMPENSETTEICSLITKAVRERDTLVIAAVGNKAVQFPGSLDNVVSVGSVDHYRKLADNSGCSHDPADGKPDLVGYGVRVRTSTYVNEGGRSRYGPPESATSYAAAYVTGIAALYWSESLDSTAEQIRDQLFTNALRKIDTGSKPAHCAGRGLAVYTKQ